MRMQEARAALNCVMISDTHGLHRELELPNADILIHAGDFCLKGTLEEVQDFADWLATCPHQHKIVVAGNHDLAFEQTPKEAQSCLQGVAHYLQDTSLVVEGIHFWGAPWTPKFFNYAFMRPRGEAMRPCWAKIPTETQVLITHGPAFACLDTTLNGTHAGCEALSERLEHLPHLKWHIHGHIHESYGVQAQGAERYSINASSCRWGEEGLNPPIILQWYLDTQIS